MANKKNELGIFCKIFIKIDLSSDPEFSDSDQPIALTIPKTHVKDL